jgi:hypothetical protein
MLALRLDVEQIQAVEIVVVRDPERTAKEGVRVMKPVLSTIVVVLLFVASTASAEILSVRYISGPKPWKCSDCRGKLVIEPNFVTLTDGDPTQPKVIFAIPIETIKSVTPGQPPRDSPARPDDDFVTIAADDGAYIFAVDKSASAHLLGQLEGARRSLPRTASSSSKAGATTPSESRHGIMPLDAATFEEAKKGAPYATNSPTALAFASRSKENRSVSELSALVSRTKDAPFSFTVMSPFMSVIAIVENAKRKYTDPQFPSLDRLNADKVQIMVFPGGSILTVDTIENVIIKRGDQIIRPLKAAVTPTVVQNNAGAQKDSANGVFTFDYATFEPDSAITFVLIGKSRNFEWTLEPNEVAQLR